MSVYRVGQVFRVAFGRDKNGWKLTRKCAVYECDCGNRFVMQTRSEKVSKSCGCLAKESAKKLLTGNSHRKTHGMSNTGIYKTWVCMRNRCEDTSNIGFELYGGRGIKVCERWQTFETFRDDMGGKRPRGTSIDRIDPDGDYCPENCRWSTAKEQARNRRRNVIVEIDGEPKTVAEWAEETGVNDKAIYYRVKNGHIGRAAVFGVQE